MKKKYIIFDFDGTLVNTNDMIIRSWQGTFEHYLGHSIDEDVIVATFGEVLTDTAARMIPGEDTDEVCRFYDEFQQKYCSGMADAFDGIRELLDELRVRDCRIGMATSRRRNSYDRYMDELGLADYIDAAVVREDVSSHKPDPEAALKVMEKLGAVPAETIFIGDTKYDAGCAKAAGIDCALAGWSHKIDMEQLEQDNCVPEYIFDKPSDLLALI
ncbi:MAG: HAD-IA family hydrolase [Mogibacterium sp.]|nr:HAD-IA family hydrolase [Mogibacterium sp.]